MRKMDKKRDNTIVAALTQVCHTAQEEGNGFQWLTHTVNYQNFPDSLTVVCVYDELPAESVKSAMCRLIQSTLAKQAISLPNPARQIQFKQQTSK
ncbi:hypothetical protein [Photobacterium leiognathi]|uniref:hypothetical protein n=1 Tax=Photobacterium leiognathi TaxID=553611 RepID=UPI0029811FEB|nr:hypothetical protein [Photobacterium leiognathi]